MSKSGPDPVCRRLLVLRPLARQVTRRRDVDARGRHGLARLGSRGRCRRRRRRRGRAGARGCGRRCLHGHLGVADPNHRPGREPAVVGGEPEFDLGDDAVVAADAVPGRAVDRLGADRDDAPIGDRHLARRRGRLAADDQVRDDAPVGVAAGSGRARARRGARRYGVGGDRAREQGDARDDGLGAGRGVPCDRRGRARRRRLRRDDRPVLRVDVGAADGGLRRGRRGRGRGGDGRGVRERDLDGPRRRRCGRLRRRGLRTGGAERDQHGEWAHEGEAKAHCRQDFATPRPRPPRRRADRRATVGWADGHVLGDSARCTDDLLHAGGRVRGAPRPQGADHADRAHRRHRRRGRAVRRPAGGHRGGRQRAPRDVVRRRRIPRVLPRRARDRVAPPRRRGARARAPPRRGTRRRRAVRRTASSTASASGSPFISRPRPGCSSSSPSCRTTSRTG